MPLIATSQRRVLNPPTELAESQNLSVAELSVTTTTTRPYALNYITVNTTGLTVQTITITIVSNKGAAFDTEILKEKICLIHFIYQPDEELTFEQGNQIRVEVTNADLPSVTANTLISTQEL